MTISGTNLAGATSVKFNGVAAATYTATDTQITATVPSGATSGPISVTTGGGSATSTASFTVTVPDFSLAASPANQIVVRGASTSYAITVTPNGGFNGNVDLVISGTPAGATTSFAPSSTGSTSTLNIQTTNSTKTGSYTLTITGTSGTLKRSTTVTLQVRRK